MNEQTRSLARSPVVSGNERPLPVVGAVLVVLAVRLEELGEGGGRPLGFAHQDVRNGGPLHRSLPAIRYNFLTIIALHSYGHVSTIIIFVVILVRVSWKSMGAKCANLENAYPGGWLMRS